jgi:cytochrome P450
MPPNIHPQLFYTEMVRLYNLREIFYLDLGPLGPSMVVITNPRLMDNSSLPKPLPLHPITAVFMKPMLGEGTMAAANGALWRKIATAVSPAFSMSYVRSMTSIMVDECLFFQQQLDKLAVTGDVFSMKELIAKLVFGIASTVTLGEPQYSQTIGSQTLKGSRDLVNLAQGEMDLRISYNPAVQIPRRWKRRQIASRLDISLIERVNGCVDRIVKEGVVPSRQNPRSIMDLLLRDHVEAVMGRRKKGLDYQMQISKLDENLILSK